VVSKTEIVATSITVQEPSKELHCEHEYQSNKWRCMKCGYQIPPELIARIAETGSGKIMATLVY
jgi:hypothetical protein